MENIGIHIGLQHIFPIRTVRGMSRSDVLTSDRKADPTEPNRTQKHFGLTAV